MQDTILLAVVVPSLLIAVGAALVDAKHAWRRVREVENELDRLRMQYRKDHSGAGYGLGDTKGQPPKCYNT
jgi:hypothetical protein